MTRLRFAQQVLETLGMGARFRRTYARYDGDTWTTPFTPQYNTIFDNHVHSTAFDSIGNVWVGRIKNGVSQRRITDGDWVHHTAAPGGIGGSLVRDILVRREHANHPESVWIATEDGGVCTFENDKVDCLHNG